MTDVSILLVGIRDEVAIERFRHAATSLSDMIQKNGYSFSSSLSYCDYSRAYSGLNEGVGGIAYVINLHSISAEGHFGNIPLSFIMAIIKSGAPLMVYSTSYIDGTSIGRDLDADEGLRDVPRFIAPEHIDWRGSGMLKQMLFDLTLQAWRYRKATANLDQYNLVCRFTPPSPTQDATVTPKHPDSQRILDAFLGGGY